MKDSQSLLMQNQYQHLIIGSGIIGLAMARAIKKKQPGATLLIIDKEPQEAMHASSRNSGVLHAGFYYTADSLKARFTVAGNRALKDYCRQKNLPLNECGKVVVAQNDAELKILEELEARGRKNGAKVALIDENRARTIDPNVKTHQKALYSPDTASIDPAAVCASLKDDLIKEGVKFFFQTRYLGRKNNTVQTTQGDFTADHVINCAGLYADKVARDFGFGQDYLMMPFKGLYLKYTKNKTDVRLNIYPVPNLKNPFLGVHFTKTVTGDIKIGPTAIPALWRENYNFTTNFHWEELGEILSCETQMFCRNASGFRALAFEELKKYNKDYFIHLAAAMVHHIDPKGFTEYTLPGIRAQLVNRKNFNLVQDFVVEGDAQSTHILNAVSPAFTCAFPFAEYIVENYLS